MHEIEFERDIDKVLARATDEGVWIIGAWTVGISKEKAMSYVNNYNSSPAEGFFELDGSVILSHAAGKITFTPQEASAVVSLIKEAYM
jgi:hypothetical protein